MTKDYGDLKPLLSEIIKVVRSSKFVSQQSVAQRRMRVKTIVENHYAKFEKK